MIVIHSKRPIIFFVYNILIVFIKINNVNKSLNKVNMKTVKVLITLLPVLFKIYNISVNIQTIAII